MEEQFKEKMEELGALFQNLIEEKFQSGDFNVSLDDFTVTISDGQSKTNHKMAHRDGKEKFGKRTWKCRRNEDGQIVCSFM